MSRALGPVVLAAAAFAVPSADGQVTARLQAARTCYRPGQRVVLTGGGYHPGGRVVLRATLEGDRGRRSLRLGSPLSAGRSGALRARVAAPRLAVDSDVRERLTIGAYDAASAAAQPLATTPPLATTQVTLSLWAVLVPAWRFGRGDPRAGTYFVAVGWVPHRCIYAHYFRGGERVHSAAIGAVSGECGDLHTRIRQFPFRPFRAGRWTVYFSPTQVFHRRGPWLRGRVVVAPGKAVGTGRGG